MLEGSVEHASNGSLREISEFSIILLFGGYLLVDSLNGMLMTKFALPSVLSVAYKQLMLVMLLLYSYVYARKAFITSCLLLMTVFTWFLFRFTLVDGLHALEPLQEAIKAAYFFIVVAVVSDFKFLQLKHLKNILVCFIAVLLLNVFVTLLGIGERAYGDFGAKGFFYAGNALSGVLVICASYFLTKIYSRSLVLFLLIGFFLAALSLVIGTKSGFLGIVLLMGLLILINLDARSLLLSFVTVFLLSIAAFLLIEQISQNPLVERVRFFYQQGGIYYALFSGRETFLITLWPVLLDADIYQMLFGIDIEQLYQVKRLRSEMDWLDMYIYFGTVLCLVCSLGYVGVLARLWLVRHTLLGLSALLSFILLILISLIAGHVMFNGMVTPLWGLVCAFALNKNVGAKQVLKEESF
ncbi:MAG: hypothetical protein GJ680_08965 [Alteromonadaceae bacterium]|nr:hypothetical protein [Alteromonadaceae bacterium]